MQLSRLHGYHMRNIIITVMIKCVIIGIIMICDLLSRYCFGGHLHLADHRSMDHGLTDIVNFRLLTHMTVEKALQLIKQV